MNHTVATIIKITIGLILVGAILFGVYYGVSYYSEANKMAEELQIGNLKYRFEDPVAYPGLRMKNTPTFVNALLCGAFLLMIAGLYITFFCQPILMRVDPDGCTVGGTKPEGMNLIVKRILQEETE
ncbi:MAG: hypothetical protein IKS87_09410 [Lachnospiraceae bacterium]|nr:hypothetical protein [Lachnospiraceae bacterium]